MICTWACILDRTPSPIILTRIVELIVFFKLFYFSQNGCRFSSKVIRSGEKISDSACGNEGTSSQYLRENESETLPRRAPNDLHTLFSLTVSYPAARSSLNDSCMINKTQRS